MWSSSLMLRVAFPFILHSVIMVSNVGILFYFFNLFFVVCFLYFISITIYPYTFPPPLDHHTVISVHEIFLFFLLFNPPLYVTFLLTADLVQRNWSSMNILPLTMIVCRELTWNSCSFSFGQYFAFSCKALVLIIMDWKT